MKNSYLIPGAMLTLVAATALALLMPAGPTGSAQAAEAPFRCTDSSFYFPSSGVVGWRYGDVDSTDTDSQGNLTVHTGIDVFAEGGDGSPVYAPADGVVSRQHGSDNVNLVFPAVTNVLTGESGIEMYYTHLRHSLVIDQVFKAGEIIGVQEGDHVHLSVGAAIGYDDREIDQTQDPSPYFKAELSYTSEQLLRLNAADWCHPATSTKMANVRLVRQECLPSGRVRIVLEQDGFHSRDWVDLSIFDNGFASDFLGLRASVSPFIWDGLIPGTQHFLRINRPVGAEWFASPTLTFLTRSDC